jgi:putative transposase
LVVIVHDAHISDQAGADWVLEAAVQGYPTVVHLWADQGYRGELVAWCQEQWGIELEIVQKPAGPRGFAPLPRRWAMERSLAWYGRSRRLSKDYEHEELYSETMVNLASISTTLRRVASSQGTATRYRSTTRASDTAAA